MKDIKISNNVFWFLHDQEKRCSYYRIHGKGITQLSNVKDNVSVIQKKKRIIKKYA